MYKYLNREEALARINSWILDGSRLESWGAYADAEWLVLRGKDGVREEFYIFHTQEAYDAAVNYEPGLES